MKTNIFISKKIKVGFQNRNDTYTKKLAYVIYYDQKGQLRKESSWNSWRDTNIQDEEFENQPTSGFVLNKKVGGDDTGWNHRQTYVRVYDPRGFEFEISIPNLIYILENTNSIKGKGLEGEFVYAWDGTELLLLPTSAPEYIDIADFNYILYNKTYIKSKELILGATYKHKNSTNWVYMGRFDCYCNWNSDNKGKQYFFVNESYNDYYKKMKFNILTLKSLGDKIISVVSSECTDNYAELFDKLEHSREYSPLDKDNTEYIPLTFEEFSSKLSNCGRWCYFNCYDYICKTEIKIDNSETKHENIIHYRVQNNHLYTVFKGTLEEIFKLFNPSYKNEYLKNGKLYRSGKYE